MSDDLTGEDAFKIVLDELIEARFSDFRMSKDKQEQLDSLWRELEVARRERDAAQAARNKADKLAKAGLALWQVCNKFVVGLRARPAWNDSDTAFINYISGEAAEALDPDHIPF